MEFEWFTMVAIFDLGTWSILRQPPIRSIVQQWIRSRLYAPDGIQSEYCAAEMCRVVRIKLTCIRWHWESFFIVLQPPNGVSESSNFAPGKRQLVMFVFSPGAGAGIWFVICCWIRYVFILNRLRLKAAYRRDLVMLASGSFAKENRWCVVCVNVEGIRRVSCLWALTHLLIFLSVRAKVSAAEVQCCALHVQGTILGGDKKRDDNDPWTWRWTVRQWISRHEFIDSLIDCWRSNNDFLKNKVINWCRLSVSECVCVLGINTRVKNNADKE